LVKNLFIPFREQKSRVEIGRSYVVLVYIDDLTNRITGTTKIEDHIRHDSTSFREKEKVKALVYRRTPSGYLCIIENRCLGMIYENEVSDDLLDYLEEHKSSDLHDKSAPGDIYRVFGVSKKVFKKAIGKLYKEKRINLSPGKIELAPRED